jgi:hypothetical protein
MGRRSYTREYKLETVRLVTERGVSLAQASDPVLHVFMTDTEETARTFKTAWFAKAARKATTRNFAGPSRKCGKIKPTTSAGVCSRSA